MQIAVCCKVVRDDQDIVVNPDRSLDVSRAHMAISSYDQNALEAAAQLAEKDGAKVVAFSVGGPEIDDSKVKKAILSRGVDELFMFTCPDGSGLDAHQTAQLLAELFQTAGGADLIVCGDGSADNYAQQVDVQLAEAMGLPCVTSVAELSVEGGSVKAKRLLEHETETVEVAMPCVVSVVPDIAEPRICGMKEILAAGKKPSQVSDAEDAAAGAAAVEVVEVKAPEPQPRRNEIFDSAVDGDIDKFVAAFKEALR